MSHLTKRDIKKLLYKQQLIQLYDGYNTRNIGVSTSNQCLNRVMMVSKDLREIYRVRSFLATKKEDGTVYPIDFSKVIEAPKELYNGEDYRLLHKWNYENMGCKWVNPKGWEHPYLNTLEFYTGSGNGLLIIKKLSLKFPRVMFLLEYDLDGFHDEKNLVYIRNGELKGCFNRVEMYDEELNSKFFEY